MSNTKILLGFKDINESGTFNDGDGNFSGMSVNATKISILKIDTAENIKAYLIKEKANIEEANKIYKSLDGVGEYGYTQKEYNNKYAKANKLSAIRKYTTFLMIDGEDLTHLIK